MTHSRPRCAWCGGRLYEPYGVGSVEIHRESAPGHPRIGWHDHPDLPCVDMDPVAKGMIQSFGDAPMSDEEWAARARDIDGRGQGRVVSGKAWKRSEA